MNFIWLGGAEEKKEEGEAREKEGKGDEGGGTSLESPDFSYKKYTPSFS